jgi:hypothetical protein
MTCGESPHVPDVMKCGEAPQPFSSKEKGRDWGLGLQGRGSGFHNKLSPLRTSEEAVTAVSRVQFVVGLGLGYSPHE